MSLLPDRAPSRRPPQPKRRDTDLFSLSGSVGPEGENRREDIIKVQTLLDCMGDYSLPHDFPTGWPGDGLWQAIRKLQKRNGLKADGTILPLPSGGVDADGVGETLAAMRDEVGDRVAGQRAYTPAEVDAHYEDEARFRNTVAEEAARPAGSASQAPIVSDISNAEPPQAKPGERLALAPVAALAPLAVRALPLLAPLAGAAGEWARQQYENARSNAEAADPMPQTPPSRPMNDNDKAASQTPPLVPPDVSDRLQGRPAEEPEPTIEQLIPPEMTDWYEGLEPFDQALAKQLMLLLNRRGDKATQLGNARLTKALMDRFNSTPGLAGKIEHVAGSRKNGVGVDLKEEHIPHPETGRKGGHWPDMTFRLARELADELGFEYLRVNSALTLKRNPEEVVKRERDQRDGIRLIKPADMIETVEKLRPDEDGNVSDNTLAEYDKEAAAFARKIVNAIEEKRKRKPQ